MFFLTAGRLHNESALGLVTGTDAMTIAHERCCGGFGEDTLRVKFRRECRYPDGDDQSRDPDRFHIP